MVDAKTRNLFNVRILCVKVLTYVQLCIQVCGFLIFLQAVHVISVDTYTRVLSNEYVSTVLSLPVINSKRIKERLFCIKTTAE